MFSNRKLLIEIALILIISFFYYRILSRYKNQISKLEKEIHQLKTTRHPIQPRPPLVPARQAVVNNSLDDELTNELQELMKEQTIKKKSVQFNLEEPDSPDLSKLNDSQTVQKQPQQPVQAQPVQAQPIKKQPKQVQPVQAQPVQAEPKQKSNLNIKIDSTLRVKPQKIIDTKPTQTQEQEQNTIQMPKLNREIKLN